MSCVCVCSLYIDTAAGTSEEAAQKESEVISIFH